MPQCDQGIPDFEIGQGKLEPGGEHSDDGEGAAVHPHFFAQDLRIAAELPLPKRLADQDHVVMSGLLFCFFKPRPNSRDCPIMGRRLEEMAAP